jgi:hypothetical protein
VITVGPETIRKNAMGFGIVAMGQFVIVPARTLKNISCSIRRCRGSNERRNVRLG